MPRKEVVCPRCGEKAVIKYEGRPPARVKCTRCGHIYEVDSSDTPEEHLMEDITHTLGLKKHTIASILLIIASVLGLVFASTIYANAADNTYTSTTTEGYGKVFGTVLDENGTGIEDVTVYIKDIDFGYVRTDNRGMFIIDNIITGDHILVCEKPGYITEIVHLTIEPGKTTVLEITLKNGTGESGSGSFTSHIERERYIDTHNLNIYLAYLLLASSVITFVSGIMVMYHRYYRLSLIGTVFGVITIGYLIGTLLSITAMAIILISREEFD